MGLNSDGFKKGLNKIHHIDIFLHPCNCISILFKNFKQKVLQAAEYSPKLALIKILNPICSDSNDRGFKCEISLIKTNSQTSRVRLSMFVVLF